MLEVLQMLFKVKRDILPVHKPFFDRFGDFWLCFLGFLIFPIGLIRPFGSGKQFISDI